MSLKNGSQLCWEGVGRQVKQTREYFKGAALVIF